MDAQISTILTDFKNLLSARGLSEEQQKKVESGLGEAVAINLIGRLADKLSEEQRSALDSQKPKTLDEVANFLGDHIPADEIKAALGAASEEILNKFLDKIA